ncbi:hypothetical protein [Streptosporangium sp. NPDC049644]|uniref:hypothetical protein n=1 Tax=Streptosporangium sp. NPDC049644 TaxID=3155507 RepID=UPI003441D505
MRARWWPFAVVLAADVLDLIDATVTTLVSTVFLALGSVTDTRAAILAVAACLTPLPPRIGTEPDRAVRGAAPHGPVLTCGGFGEPCV